MVLPVEVVGSFYLVSDTSLSSCFIIHQVKGFLADP